MNTIINNTVNSIPAAAALDAALREAGLRREELCGPVTVRQEEGLYVFSFRCAWMEHLCYVDAVSGEVPGHLAQPAEEELPEALTAQYPELLFSAAG